MAEAETIMCEGCGILAGVLEPHGFRVEAIKTGSSSGGGYTSCGFVRNDRRLELHYRYSLGLVNYHLGAAVLAHEDYMWSVLGRRWASKYPGHSEDPLDGFRHLASDIAEYGADFLTGSDQEFLHHIARAAKLQRTTPRLPA